MGSIDNAMTAMAKSLENCKAFDRQSLGSSARPSSGCDELTPSELETLSAGARDWPNRRLVYQFDLHTPFDCLFPFSGGGDSWHGY